MRHFPGTKAGARISRFWPAAVAASAAVALAATMTAAATAATRTAGGSAKTHSVTLYAVGKRACAAPRRAHAATCFAEIRKVVKKGTQGARPFKVAAGATKAGTIGPAGGLTPGDLGTAYGLTTTGGHGQTVAIVDAYNDPHINADLQTFDSHYGLAACSTTNGCLRVVNQSGGTAPPANDTTGWSVEESLDVETVHSVCQGCKIILVEANSPGNSDLATAENKAVALGATEVSNSFGEPEAGTSPSFQAAFNHPGVVITASAGDDGYYFYDQLAGIDQPGIPAAYNTTVSVGGTSLYLGQTAARQSESVWNDNGPRDVLERDFGQPLGAGGGGCSTLFSAQLWQTALSTWGSTGCGSKRLDSDVSAVADYLTGFDIYDSYNCGSACAPAPGWFTVGGTSLSSPIIASAYALAGGARGVAYPALTLYGHQANAYDVTTGGNGWCDGQGAAQCPNPNLLGDGTVDCAYTAGGSVAVGDRACDALAGYDGPTGVGSPKGLTMFTRTGPSATNSGPATVTHGTSQTWHATTTDPFPGGAVTRYTWNWGDGSSTTSTGSAAHTYATGGVTRTITLTVTDNYGMTGSATYIVKVN